MAKKFGKFLLFTAAAGTAAVAAYYYIRKKDSALSDFMDEDDDYDDFSDDLEEDDTTRNYVPLSFDGSSATTEGHAVAGDESKEDKPETVNYFDEEEDGDIKDEFTPLSSQVAQAYEAKEQNVETSVEEFFDEEDSDDEEPPIIDNDDE